MAQQWEGERPGPVRDSAYCSRAGAGYAALPLCGG